MKKWLLLCGCILCVAAIPVTLLINTYIAKHMYEPENSDTYFDESNVVKEEDLEKISTGMSYGQIIRKIGKANTTVDTKNNQGYYASVGLGLRIFRYQCSNGKQASLYLDDTDHLKAMIIGPTVTLDQFKQFVANESKVEDLKRVVGEAHDQYGGGFVGDVYYTNDGYIVVVYHSNGVIDQIERLNPDRTFEILVG